VFSIWYFYTLFSYNQWLKSQALNSSNFLRNTDGTKGIKVLYNEIKQQKLSTWVTSLKSCLTWVHCVPYSAIHFFNNLELIGESDMPRSMSLIKFQFLLTYGSLSAQKHVLMSCIPDIWYLKCFKSASITWNWLEYLKKVYPLYHFLKCHCLNSYLRVVFLKFLSISGCHATKFTFYRI